MTAQEFANEHEHVVVRWAGNGCPGGQDVALLPETELPFSLAEVEGEIGEQGAFEATNLDNSRDVYEWRFHDWNMKLIYAIWLRVDPEVWEKQWQEYNE